VGLRQEDYSEEQIEAAVASIYGVDSELISDGTYFVVERDGELVGCGTEVRPNAKTAGLRVRWHKSQPHCNRYDFLDSVGEVKKHDAIKASTRIEDVTDWFGDGRVTTLA
jgi:hypothetical protein